MTRNGNTDNEECDSATFKVLDEDPDPIGIWSQALKFLTTYTD